MNDHQTIKLKSGVYQIIHVESGRKYVGSAADVGKRIGTHKACLRRNKHVNIALQKAYNKYGEDAFCFEKILKCSVNELVLHEQRLIDELNAHASKGGYNIRIIAESSLGVRMKSRAYKTGDKYGRLTFLEQIDDTERTKIKHMWRLRCDCGAEIIASAGNVKSGVTRSCGCYKKDRIAETKRSNRSGEKYNRLTFVCAVGVQEKTKSVLWKCLCDCGKSTIVPLNRVLSGNTKSCGCLNLESARNRMKKMRAEKTIKIRLFGKEMCMLKATNAIGISKNALAYRVKALGETYEKACDHFICKNNLKTIVNCKAMLAQTLQGIAA